MTDATEHRAATLGPLAKTEGKKRAEAVVPATDPQFLPWFQLGFIDGAYWGFALTQQMSEPDDA